MRVVCGEEGDGESGEKDRLLVYLKGEEEEGEGGGDLCVCVCVCVECSEYWLKKSWKSASSLRKSRPR